MATVDSSIATQTAEALLKQIEQTAKQYTAPEHLRNLAEAFSLVAGSVRSDKTETPKNLGGFA